MSPTGGSPGIVAFWDDLDSSGAGQGVSYQTLGVPGDRRVVVQWVTAQSGGSASTIDVQLVLFERGDIELRYSDVAFGTAGDAGASATVGLSFGPAGPGLQFSCDTASLSPGLALRFYAR